MAGQQIDAPVAVGIDELHPWVGQLQARRRLVHQTRTIVIAIPQVAPIADDAVHLEHVGQAVAKQVGQLQVGAGQGAGRQLRTLDGKEPPPFRLEAGVAEFQLGQRFCLVAVVPGHLDLAEQRDAVERERPGRIIPLIEVDQAIGSHQALLVGVRADLDMRAAPAGAYLKAGAVIGKGVGTIFVE